MASVARAAGDLVGWAVLYGREREHVALFVDRARAEIQAVRLHGELCTVVIGQFRPESIGDAYGLDIDLDT